MPATAICGNDIPSSCLYVPALAIIYSGKWAPLVLLLVAGVLYLYRAIYAEVVGALPLNGGAYNALLNTTSKFRASISSLPYHFVLYGYCSHLRQRSSSLWPYGRPGPPCPDGNYLSARIVLTGLIGNAMLNLHHLAMFLEYFIPAILLISIMLGRVKLLKGYLFLVSSIVKFLEERMSATSLSIGNQIDRITSQQIIFFTRGENLANLNQAMLFVQENEDSNRIKVVIVVADEQQIAPNLKRDLEFLNETYPEIDIEFVKVIGRFSPELIRELSEQWGIPPNLMFIGSPGTHFVYGLADLGGVRLII